MYTMEDYSSGKEARNKCMSDCPDLHGARWLGLQRKMVELPNLPLLSPKYGVTKRSRGGLPPPKGQGEQGAAVKSAPRPGTQRQVPKLHGGRVSPLRGAGPAAGGRPLPRPLTKENGSVRSITQHLIPQQLAGGQGAVDRGRG